MIFLGRIGANQGEFQRIGAKEGEQAKQFGILQKRIKLPKDQRTKRLKDLRGRGPRSEIRFGFRIRGLAVSGNEE